MSVGPEASVKALRYWQGTRVFSEKGAIDDRNILQIF